MKLDPTRAAIGALEEVPRLLKDGYRLTGWVALACMGVRAVQGGLRGGGSPAGVCPPAPCCSVAPVPKIKPPVGKHDAIYAGPGITQAEKDRELK